MRSAFEVGAVFKIVDEATGPLRKILAEVRELTKSINAARESLAGFSGAVAPGIAGAITGVNDLAAAWARVTKATEDSVAAAKLAATEAKAAISSIPAAVAPARAATAAAATSVPNFRPGVGQGAAAEQRAAVAASGGAAYLPGLSASAKASMHVTGPGIPLPGGSHARFAGTPALVGAAALGYGITEASTMEFDTDVLNYHIGRPSTPENNAQAREIIEGGMKSTGESLPEVAKAATIVAQLMRDVPGFDVLKELPHAVSK